MLIGEICKRTELSKDTIRFYEKKGLLKVNRSDSEYNNYKEYTTEHVKTLLLIKNAKLFGFTLNEIKELSDLMKMDLATCSTLRQRVTDKISDIDKRISELMDMKNMILSSLSQPQNRHCNKSNAGNCEQLN